MCDDNHMAKDARNIFQSIYIFFDQYLFNISISHLLLTIMDIFFFDTRTHMVSEALSITVLVYGNTLSNNLYKVAFFLSGNVNRKKRQKLWQRVNLFIFSTYFFPVFSFYSAINFKIACNRKVKNKKECARYRKPR